MITKAEAKQAWQTITVYSMQHTSKSFSVDDITYKVQNAVMLLNEYFNQGDEQ